MSWPLTRIGRWADVESALFDQMKVPLHLALDADDGAIGDFLVGRPVQRYANRKAARVTSDDLDAAYGFAPWPLSDGIEAFLAKLRIVHPSSDRFRHKDDLLSSAASKDVPVTEIAALRQIRSFPQDSTLLIECFDEEPPLYIAVIIFSRTDLVLAFAPSRIEDGKLTDSGTGHSQKASELRLPRHLEPLPDQLGLVSRS
jgi:hypothetical protein